MKKKQIIGLGTLLLVFLLGLFTTCYADSQHTWTDIELKNVLYRYWLVTWNKNEDEALQLVNSVETQITQFVTDINNRECIIIKANSGQLYLVCLTNNIIPYVSSNFLYFNTYNNNCYYYLVNNSGYNMVKFSNLNDIGSWQISNNYMYTSVNIRLNNTSGAPWWSAGYFNPSTFFNEWYWTSDRFEFDMNEYSSTQYVNVTFNGTTYNNVPVYYKPTDTSQVPIGTLINTSPVTLKEDFYGLIYWNGSSWVTSDIQERDLNTFVYSSSYLSINSNSDMTEYNYGQIPRFAPRDCFYFYSIDDVDYNRAYALWYIGSSKTVISGDQIDPTTFDDYPDYDDNVKNALNNIDDIDNIVAGTEPIVDTLTNDDDVSGELAAFISGDADDLAAKFGYNPVENPFTTVVLDIVQNLTDVLLGSGDATIDLSYHGLSWVIHSNDIYLPPGRITTFIHLMCNAWFIWGIYKYGFKLYEWIQSGRLQNLVNETNRHQYFLF